MNKLIGLILISLSLLFSSCSHVSTNQPEYVKSVVAYPAGADGVIIYFSLADASGRYTASNGRVTVTIKDVNYQWSDRRKDFMDIGIELWSKSFDVKHSDFVNTTIGVGNLERKAVIYSVGRIPYSAFKRNPYEKYGKIEILFRKPNGQYLKGEARTVF